MQAPTAYTPRLEISRLWDKADGKLEKAGVVFLGVVGSPIHVLDVLACGVAACRGRPLLSRSVAIADVNHVPSANPDRKHAGASDAKHSDGARRSPEAIKSRVVEAGVRLGRAGSGVASYAWSKVLPPGADVFLAVEGITACLLPNLKTKGRLLPGVGDKNFYRSFDAPDAGWSSEQKVKAAAYLLRCLVACDAPVAEALEFVLGITFPPATIHKSTKAFDLNSRVNDRDVMDSLLLELVAAAGGSARLDENAARLLMSSNFPGWDFVSPQTRASALGERVSHSKAIHARAASPDAWTGKSAPFALDLHAAELGGVMIKPADRKALYKRLLDRAPTLEPAELETVTRAILRALTRDPAPGEAASKLNRKEFRRLALKHLDALRDAVNARTFAALPKDRSDVLLREVSAVRAQLG